MSVSFLSRLSVQSFLALCTVFAILCGFLAEKAQARPFRLMVFGDSLVHGYGLPQGQSFPDQLQDRLDAAGYAVEVINAGNSGDTTAAGLARVDWALADRPDLVIVVLGANDSLRGLDPAQTRRNLRALLARFQDASVKILLTGMQAPRNLGADYVRDFDRLYPELAHEAGLAFYPFFLAGVALVRDLNQADGIHPNAAGVKKITEHIWPTLLPLLPPQPTSSGQNSQTSNVKKITVKNILSCPV